jgi:predicted AlkP superfamily phosphohydrolase/phosphomutase
MNPGHPDYNETLCQTIFERFYRRLDEKIREIHDAFGRKAGCPFITVILSDHGFQSHLKRVNLGWWLVKEGLLKVRKISPRRYLQYHIKRLAGRKMVLRAEFLWEQSRVYSFNRGNAGYLYFLETESKKRQATQEHLRSFLESLRDPDTGSRLLRRFIQKILFIMEIISIECQTGLWNQQMDTPLQGTFFLNRPDFLNGSAIRRIFI